MLHLFFHEAYFCSFLMALILPFAETLIMFCGIDAVFLRKGDDKKKNCFISSYAGMRQSRDETMRL